MIPKKRFLLVWSLALLALFSLAACNNEGDGGGQSPSQPDAGVPRRDVLKIEIKEDGFYRLTLSDLTANGLDVETLDPATLRLSQRGETVPYLLRDEALIFYGQAPADRYLATRPYLLRVGEAGAVMAETAVAPAGPATLNQVTQTLHREENNEYVAQARRSDNPDLWFWRKIPQQETADFSLNLASVGPGPAQLRLHFWGVSQSLEADPDHDLELLLNDSSLGAIRWDGETYYTATVAIPAGRLQAGNNTIRLDNSAPGAALIDIVQLNWIELTYSAPPLAVNDRLAFRGADGVVHLDGFSDPPLLFDVADPAAPRRLSGTECDAAQACAQLTGQMDVVAVGPAGFRQPAAVAPLRQSDWGNSAHQADLLIVTTDQLVPALAPLVAARQEAGITAVVIPVAEIYDEFGYGAASPQSIQTFVAHAVAAWAAPAPRYLLLVGDATSDYRNYLGEAPQNIVPAPMVPVQYSGETVSDSRLADVDDDVTPELAVGRWPVDNVASVESLVERTLAYEAGAAPTRALFAADGTEPQFTTLAERLAQAAGVDPDNAAILTGPTAQEVVAKWNEGAWLTTYVGHGSVNRWGKEDVLIPEAISDLQTDSPSIVLQLTCLTGLFAHPSEISLTEQMMRHEQGPPLHVAATSLTLSSDQEVFAAALLAQLQDPDTARIGDAFQIAKESLNVENSHGLREISDTFALFGDPSAAIVRPAGP